MKDSKLNGRARLQCDGSCTKTHSPETSMRVDGDALFCSGIARDGPIHSIDIFAVYLSFAQFFTVT
jgi:hypothetical protein